MQFRSKFSKEAEGGEYNDRRLLRAVTKLLYG
jgi:hypothetical protein